MVDLWTLDSTVRLEWYMLKGGVTHVTLTQSGAEQCCTLL